MKFSSLNALNGLAKVVAMSRSDKRLASVLKRPWPPRPPWVAASIWDWNNSHTSVLASHFERPHCNTLVLLMIHMGNLSSSLGQKLLLNVGGWRRKKCDNSHDLVSCSAALHEVIRGFSHFLSMMHCSSAAAGVQPWSGTANQRHDKDSVRVTLQPGMKRVALASRLRKAVDYSMSTCLFSGLAPFSCNFTWMGIGDADYSQDMRFLISIFPSPQPTDPGQRVTTPPRDTSATTAAPTNSSPTPSRPSAPPSSPSLARAMRGQFIFWDFVHEYFIFFLKLFMWTTTRTGKQSN